MGEVTARASDLPDALVGLIPVALQEVEDRELEAPRLPLLLEAVGPSLVEEVEDLPVDVELELSRRRVADPDWFRTLVPREPVELQLRESPLPRRPVDDLELFWLSRDGAQEPVAPLLRLLLVAGAQ